MNNSCEVSSQRMVYLTNLLTMFKFVLEKLGKCYQSEKASKIAAEEFYIASF